MVGAVVDGQPVLLAVEREAPSGDPVGETAGRLAEAGAVADVIGVGAVPQRHVGHAPFTVGNDDGRDASADVAHIDVSPRGVREAEDLDLAPARGVRC